MNRDFRSVHKEKVIEVPFTFMTEFPLKSDQSSAHERELNVN